MVEAPRSVLLEGSALCLLLEARGAPSRGLDGTPCTQGGREEAGSVEERSLSSLRYSSKVEILPESSSRDEGASTTGRLFTGQGRRQGSSWQEK